MNKVYYLYSTVLAMFLFSQNLFSQGKIQASFEYSEGKIFIYYEFQGDQNKDYEISIRLRRTSDAGFEMIPDNLSGDIGEGKFAGRKNQIIWVINEDEEAQLEGEDFYFDVTANAIEEGGGVPWYIVAGGAALAGGTAAILVLGKKDSDGTTSIPPTTGFPSPPPRP